MVRLYQFEVQPQSGSECLGQLQDPVATLESIRRPAVVVTRWPHACPALR